MGRRSLQKDDEKLKKFDELDFPAKPRWALDESALFLKGAGVKL